METREKLYFAPSAGRNNEKEQDYLIFHIPGNPGLIDYYHPFLSTLHSLLSSSSHASFHIAGHSLAGFATDERTSLSSRELAGLPRQIEYVDELLYDQVDEVRDATGKTPKVILMGHSVGAYILLEIIRRHRTRIESGKQDFDLIGGILLFPTITHIARSPSGIAASALLRIPHAPGIANAFVKFFTYLIPPSALYHLIRALSFPEHVARTTTAFIKSPSGLKRVLYLAKDELDMITDDKWGKEVWGAATEAGTNSKDTINSNLVFFWGQHDGWVARKTRNELIAARGYVDAKAKSTCSLLSTTPSLAPSDPWKPNMVIDDQKIPHAFCLKHSETVAEKVHLWIEDIITKHHAP
ncbi:MAG: hypothetical protein LQ350_004905 [Teloschistes chrysophthalmus]|nr:MAG: hypothetical protein LQ350_004905 [Niorma chrysophthalma]